MARRSGARVSLVSRPERPRSAAGDRAGRRLFRRADAARAEPKSGRGVDFGAAIGVVRDFRTWKSRRNRGRDGSRRRVATKRGAAWMNYKRGCLVARYLHASPEAARRSVARGGAAVPYRLGARAACRRGGPSGWSAKCWRCRRRKRASELEVVLKDFEARHWQTRRVFMTRYDEIEEMMGLDGAEIGDEKRQLIGAYFCHEYSYAAAALMNPSAVPHFDQSGMPSGIDAHPDEPARGGRGAHLVGRVSRGHHHREERAEAGARAALRDRRRRLRQRRGAYSVGPGDGASPPRFDAVGHGDLPDHQRPVEGAGGSAPRPVPPRRRRGRMARHLHRL